MCLFLFTFHYPKLFWFLIEQKKIRYKMVNRAKIWIWKQLLHYSLKFSGGSCPASHPYVYYNGHYCCKTNREKHFARQKKKCDGSVISRTSLCCAGDQFIKCPKGTCSNHKNASKKPKKKVTKKKSKPKKPSKKSSKSKGWYSCCFTCPLKACVFSFLLFITQNYFDS